MADDHWIALYWFAGFVVLAGVNCQSNVEVGVGVGIGVSELVCALVASTVKRAVKNKATSTKAKIFLLLPIVSIGNKF